MAPPKRRPTTSHSAEVRYTTLAELTTHIHSSPNPGFEALPPYTSLRFEPLTAHDVTIPFPSRTSVLPARLIIGYTKLPRVDRNHVVYAYICQKDDKHKASLRLGKKNLPVDVLDGIEFEEPFDRIFDRYGVSDRACDRMSLMAAYYFLAAGHLEKVAIRLDFCVIFTELCGKIYKPVGDACDGDAGFANGRGYVGDDHETSSTKAQNGEEDFRDLCEFSSRYLATVKQNADLDSNATVRSGKKEVSNQTRHNSSPSSHLDNQESSSPQVQNGDLETSSGNSGNGVPLSVMQQLSLIDFSVPAQVQPVTDTHAGSSSGEETLADKEAQKETAPIIPTVPGTKEIDSAPKEAINSGNNAPHLDDLTSFIKSYKDLKDRNTSLTADLTSSEAAANSLRDTILRLDNTINTLKYTTHTSEAALSAEKKAHQQTTAQNRHLQAALSATRLREQDLTRALAAEKTAHAATHAALRSQEDDAQAATAQHTTTQAELALVQQDFRSAQQKAHRLSQDLHNANTKLDALQIQKDALVGEKATLQAKLEHLVGSNNSLVAKNLRLVREVEKGGESEVVKGEMEGLKEKVRALEKENEEMRERFKMYGEMVKRAWKGKDV
ncbi:hypothetical protein CC80DRAFT_578853 [Byssothecium circinans]|uniref:Uncharacterized protein n=1 Tax=Byssothecium circinans TaxID=147558 RepID=A0A6A5TD99_9PLEO|nr:hypothetical protein CC80DRAFT_578853 [Byssothecium circinans]